MYERTAEVLFQVFSFFFKKKGRKRRQNVFRVRLLRRVTRSIRVIDPK